MPCDHTDPPVVMDRAEQWLRQRGISEVQWDGMRIRHAENTPNAKGWRSVIIEIERRGSEWVVTDIDRRPETLELTGISIVQSDRVA